MEDQTGMQPAAPQAAPAVPVVKQVKELLSQDKIKEKFGEVLGQKAPQFMASITNTVSGSAQLKKCPANSIIGAAFVAATYDLPIDSNLGFAAIVPYNESVWNPRKKDWEKVPKAQFQMMYKGFIATLVESVVFTEEKQRAMGIPEGTLPVGWWIGFKVLDADVWEKVKDGTYSMFSIEGEAERVEVKDEN